LLRFFIFTFRIREALKKSVFLEIIPKYGGGVGIPKLYVKCKIQIFIPKSAKGEGGGGRRFRNYS